MKRIRLILIFAIFGILALGAVSCSNNGREEIPKILQVLLYFLVVSFLIGTYIFISQWLKILGQKIDKKLSRHTDRMIEKMFSKKNESKQKKTTAIKKEKEIRIVKENSNNTDKLKEIVLSQNYTDEIRESALNHIHIRDREQIKDMIDNDNLPENIKNLIKARYEYFVQRARENREFDIKIMNENDARELVKKTESPEELKMIIKVRYDEKSLFSNYTVEDAQRKLRTILGYSLDDYYCPTCNKVVTTIQNRKGCGSVSSAGNIHFNLECSCCNCRLGKGFINENW